MTRYRQGEEETGREADQLQYLLDTAPGGHCRYTPDGTLIWASRGMEAMTGYSIDDLVGLQVQAVIHPDHLAARDEAFAQLVATRQAHTIELQAMRADGQWRWIESHVRGRFNDEGELEELYTSSWDTTERRASRELQAQWALTFENTTRGITITDPVTGIMQAVNPAFARMHGGVSAHFAGLPLVSVFTPEVAERMPELADIVHNAGYIHYEADHVRLDGSVFPIDTEVIAARDPHGTLLYRIAYYQDLTDKRRQDESEREARALFERAFADAPIGMALVGLDGRWLRVNRALRNMLGYDEETLLAKTFLDVTYPDDLDADLSHVRALLGGETASYSMEKRYVTATGQLIWVLLSVSLVRTDTGTPRYFVAQIIDISGRMEMQDRLQRLADHDSLTGLWNRRRFEEDLARLAARCRRYHEQAALIVFDLDGFKAVNDTLGHKTGDDLIGHVTRTVATRLRESDVFARIGGDEFAVILPNATIDVAERLAGDLCALVATTPCTIAGEVLRPTISAGVAMLDDGADSEAGVFVAADAAMYEAKRQGRNRAIADRRRGGAPPPALSAVLHLFNRPNRTTPRRSPLSSVTDRSDERSSTPEALSTEHDIARRLVRAHLGR